MTRMKAVDSVGVSCCASLTVMLNLVACPDADLDVGSAMSLLILFD